MEIHQSSSRICPRKGLTVEDIEFREIKGEEYVYVTKEEIGQAVEAIVPGVVDVLEVLDFPCQHALANNTLIHPPCSHFSCSFR